MRLLVSFRAGLSVYESQKSGCNGCRSLGLPLARELVEHVGVTERRSEQGEEGLDSSDICLEPGLLFKPIMRVEVSLDRLLGKGM